MNPGMGNFNQPEGANMDNVKKKILIVDKDRQACEMMSHLLGIAGYQARVVTNISVAFQYSQSQYFDLFLIGWDLEDGTGIELCKWIRCYNEETPILFFTDSSGSEDLTNVLAAGAQGYFIKPTEIGDLLLTINTEVNAIQRHTELTSEANYQS